MDDTASSTPSMAACPHCGKKFRVKLDYIGKKARCSQCSQVFEVSLMEASPAPASSPGHVTNDLLCPVCQCQTQPGESTTACPECRTSYHQECWEYNGGCAVYGCTKVPPTEHLDSLEIPASYWGQEEKPCPVCNQMILAMAVRCRHCGATFSSAQPEDAATFRQHSLLERELPKTKQTSIWILVFSVLPFTAPFAAVIGWMWYNGHREEINALPPLNIAICKLGIGMAAGQTVILVVVTLLYAIVRG